MHNPNLLMNYILAPLKQQNGFQSCKYPGNGHYKNNKTITLRNNLLPDLSNFERLKCHIKDSDIVPGD